MSAPVTGAIPTNPSPKVQLIIEFFTALCVGDWDKLNASTTEDFVQVINPKSLGFPVRNKADYIKWNQDGFSIFQNFKVSRHFLRNLQSLTAYSSTFTISTRATNRSRSMYVLCPKASSSTLSQDFS